ncbi:hypothetical protein PM022_07205 [Halorubrum ezzemoulense]|uniref:hypothetical protein n=1 Tax=Halorubrum ezzemoulense TaxID=337243 RepID=UPI002330024A|nr:hypothetical protein [Halorubrum ezzemoulense]MDB2274337.1 hypothetical protein [Halorubrum ezzemoulense]
MSDDLLNVHEEVKETFRDRIEDNDDLSDLLTSSIIELSDEEMTDSEIIQSVVQEALDNADS